MKISQAVFHVKHALLGEFVGIVAFDSSTHTASSAAQICWGTDAEMKELSYAEFADKRINTSLSILWTAV